MSKLSAGLKNKQAYLMYWALVCALCVGVGACSTDTLMAPKSNAQSARELEDSGDVEIIGEIEEVEEDSGDVEIIGEIEEVEEKLGDAQITGEIEED